MQVQRPHAWPLAVIALTLSVSVLTGCPAGTVGGATPPGQTSSSTPASAQLGFSGQALVGTVPLANATVYVHDALANRAPVAPGKGVGSQLEFVATPFTTDAQGKFTIPLTVKLGQVAYVYISDGKQALSALVGANQTSYRSTGKVTIDSANPLKVDSDSTVTAGVMLGTLSSFGKAAIAKGTTKDATKMAVITKAVEGMAVAATKTSFKLQGLTKGKDLSKALAIRMLKADPRVKAGPKPPALKKPKPKAKASLTTKFFRLLQDATGDADASDPGAGMASVAGSVAETNPGGALEAVSECANASEAMSAGAAEGMGAEGGDLTAAAQAETASDSAEQDAAMAAGAAEGAP
ncbi:MAG: hypothetical protein H7338_19535, partial [Candidatus Sericytochromatia bacterium]|nr:hypothetical protein [Candidatus Sericytochromatia bacterium]